MNVPRPERLETLGQGTLPGHTVTDSDTVPTAESQAKHRLTVELKIIDEKMKIEFSK
jgi:hypothetical protein